jgi:hypothetical protein
VNTRQGNAAELLVVLSVNTRALTQKGCVTVLDYTASSDELERILKEVVMA